MDFHRSPELDRLAEEARRVGAAAADRRDIREDGWLMGFDPEFALELAERGWIGMTWPTEVGGGGRSALERFVVYEALIGEGAPLAASYFADRQIGPTLLQYATAEQRARWLPGILAGTDVWCIGMS
jgi:alkylation response protein AidB-like acyl-CoA dehydrogenase